MLLKYSLWKNLIKNITKHQRQNMSPKNYIVYCRTSFVISLFKIRISNIFSKTAKINYNIKDVFLVSIGNQVESY